MKCAACLSTPATWTMQPFGPDDERITFTLPGSHYRGFPAIGVCDACKQLVQAGQRVAFVYKHVYYVVQENKPWQFQEGGT